MKRVALRAATRYDATTLNKFVLGSDILAGPTVLRAFVLGGSAYACNSVVARGEELDEP